MVTEIEVWRSAKLLIRHYGDAAFQHAEQKADELKAKADLDGWAKWLRIAAAVLELQEGRNTDG
jgi:hypothetical protein